MIKITLACRTDSKFPRSAQVRVADVSRAPGTNNKVGFNVDGAGAVSNQVLGISAAGNPIASYSSQHACLGTAGLFGGTFNRFVGSTIPEPAPRTLLGTATIASRALSGAGGRLHEQL